MKLFEQYRPKALDDVLGQPKAVKTIERLIERGIGGRALWISGDLARNDVLAEDPCDYVADPEDGIWSRPESWCLLIESTRRENSVHIVTAVEAVGVAVLEGFTLTGGNAYYPPYWSTTTCKDEDCGGALFNQSMAVILRA